MDGFVCIIITANVLCLVYEQILFSSYMYLIIKHNDNNKIVLYTIHHKVKFMFMSTDSMYVLL